MSLKPILNNLLNNNLTQELYNRTNRDERLRIEGGCRLAKALINSSMVKSRKQPLLVLVATLEDANRWYEILNLIGWSKVYIYPNNETSPYDSFTNSTEIEWGKLSVLSELLNEDNNDFALVATDRSLQPHLPTKEYFKSNCFRINNKQEICIDELSVKLAELGYEKVTTVEEEGSWSRRGDIVDIYPVSNELPVRLEFFGDDIEKIKEYDPLTQKSIAEINEIIITPTSIDSLILKSLMSKDNDLYQKITDKLLKNNDNNVKRNNLNNLLVKCWDNPSSLLDYIPKNTFITRDEPQLIELHAQKWFEHIEETYIQHKTEFFKDIGNLDLIPNLHRNFDRCNTELNLFNGCDLIELRDKGIYNNIYQLSEKKINIIPNNYSNISTNIKDFKINGVKIWLLTAQPTRTVALLDEHESIVRYISNVNDNSTITRLQEDKIPIVLKSTENIDIDGFYLPAWKLTVITDKEFYGQIRIGSLGYVRRRKRSINRAIKPNKLISGDYVVHRNHGIGQFQKLEKIAMNGKFRDYLVVKYLDGKLSVAADQLGSLSRYRSTNNSKPKINKLGGTTWENIVKKAKKSIKKVATDLVKLYAEREKAKGYEFPMDGPWQSELEDSFPYEPTPDQSKAFREVKKDMESHKPMDRLVCGDVGFGKTEVAIRAIFKAVTAGKQVIFLAPTTILSQQHWRTVSDRFSPYPIKVSLLNRFKSIQERSNIMEQIKEGNVDVVIGTHQLLSNKIIYKDIGLLVIDEEQRFGVNQKEKIKSFKKDVDVLTLTATPIPRTLYMSLSGVRKMSLINTPPPLRRPIQTHLSQLDDEVIRSAICQEIDRGGQVFYVVPRIEKIQNIVKKIKEMIPKINLVVAHGQMKEGDLENAMIAFNGGEIDLMICTTIVESGLDIPRVNTIIIEDSHMFGLSQLYQLRGRVGRSGIQAHAWLLFPEVSLLTDVSRKRLKAIQEFTHLGSGYQLAMRDMEIRGVGNLLGVEQSGQLEVIGFDMYMEILQECLGQINGQDIPLVDETQVDLKITAFIPSEWIINNNDKLAAYKAATDCNTEDEILELAISWNDRYGTIPLVVNTLLEVMKLKLLARKCGIYRIRIEKNNIILETQMEEPAFNRLHEGLPKNIQSRLIYQKTNKLNSLLYARGLGVLPPEKQINELIIWLGFMLEKI